MPEGGEGAENPGIANQHVKPAETLVQSHAEPVDAFVVLEIERHERGLTARGLDCVVELFKSADGAGDRDDMCARPGERKRCGVADPARGAGHKRDAAGEGEMHQRDLQVTAGGICRAPVAA